MTIETVLITAAVLGAMTFAIAYPLVTDYRRWSREGVHMWTLTVALLALGALSLARRTWGEWAGHNAAVSLTYAAIAVLLWQRVALLYLARKELREQIRARLNQP